MAKINLFLISIVLTHLSHFLSFFFFLFLLYFSFTISLALSSPLCLWNLTVHGEEFIQEIWCPAVHFQIMLIQVNHTVHLADFSKEVILYRGGSKPSSLFLLKNTSVYKWMIYQNGKWVAYHSNEEAEFWLSK